MRRRGAVGRAAALALAIVALLGCAAAGLSLAADDICPDCGAPLEPGAAFCVRCGRKLETPAAAPDKPGTAPLSDPAGAVVQVVTAHDSELTSTIGSLFFESNLRIDSILGSAFAVAPGEFVTESGLLVGAKEVRLRTSTGLSAPARVVGADPMIGVALLRADLPGIEILPLRTGTPPRTGETLTALGFSSGWRPGTRPVISTGVVSGLNRGGARIHPVEDYLQTDASLPRGLAGGPMIDPGGRVVGMSTGLVLGSRVLLGPQSGIGYAVTAEWISLALAWIRAGAAPRGWVGALAVPVEPESRERFALPAHARLFIDQVFPGSPAAAAGLRRGDGLMKFMGEEVTHLVRLQRRLLATAPGEVVRFDIARAGETIPLDVTLAPRPARPRLNGIDALRFFGALEIDARDGRRLVVGSVVPGSEPAQQKVAAGDVLQSVLSKKDWEHGAKDNARWRAVRTVDELEARLETAYSDFDFCLGLRFRSKDGTRREILLWEILTPTAAL